MDLSGNIKRFFILSFALLAVAGFVAACTGFADNRLNPDDRPPEEIVAIESSAIVLDFKLDSLSHGISRVAGRYHRQSALVEIRRDWRGHVTDAPTASMILLKRIGERLPPPPGDPKDMRGLWRKYSWRRIKFFDLYETRNKIGYVLWRRFLTGGRLCVIFQQGWGGDAPSLVLTGFYCQAPGEPFTDGQAETVVQAISVREEGGTKLPT